MADTIPTRREPDARIDDALAREAQALAAKRSDPASPYHGRDDARRRERRRFMAPTRNAKALIAALADVRTVTLPETGHSLMAERPDEVLDALRDFLAMAAT